MHSMPHFPPKSGKYEVSAGLRLLGSERALDVDAKWAEYRAVKLAGRRERLAKYLPTPVKVSDEVIARVALTLLDRMLFELPEHFRGGRAEGRIECALSGETIVFTHEGELDRARSVGIDYRDLWDALASQLQEDFAIWRLDRATQSEWLGALSIFFPNHWSPEEKIGKSFLEVHLPVADFAPVRARSFAMAEAMVERGPMRRFAWGVATDTRLNHHPDEPVGRSFNPAYPELYMRVERQTLHPFPDLGASLFSIRTTFRDVATELSPVERELLASAIRSMSPEALVYKGLDKTREAVLEWIASLSP